MEHVLIAWGVLTAIVWFVGWLNTAVIGPCGDLSYNGTVAMVFIGGLLGPPLLPLLIIYGIYRIIKAIGKGSAELVRLGLDGYAEYKATKSAKLPTAKIVNQ